MAPTTKHPLDRVLIPAKSFVYRQVFRQDDQKYLAFRARMALSVARVGLYDRGALKAISTYLKPGDVAIDVGASFGVYTDALAGLVGNRGQVHAFEPQADVYARLARRFGERPHVTVVNAALADQPGSAHFAVPTIAHDLPETALGGLSRGEDGLAVQGDTRVTTLDEYCADFDRLALIKVDAEGWDLDVLRGGAQTIRRLRPTILVEVNDAEMLAGVTALAADLGYRLDNRVLSSVNRLLRPL